MSVTHSCSDSITRHGESVARRQEETVADCQACPKGPVQRYHGSDRIRYGCAHRCLVCRPTEWGTRFVGRANCPRRRARQVEDGSQAHDQSWCLILCRERGSCAIAETRPWPPVRCRPLQFTGICGRKFHGNDKVWA